MDCKMASVTFHGIREKDLGASLSCPAHPHYAQRLLCLEGGAEHFHMGAGPRVTTVAVQHSGGCQVGYGT